MKGNWLSTPGKSPYRTCRFESGRVKLLCLSLSFPQLFSRHRVLAWHLQGAKPELESLRWRKNGPCYPSFAPGIGVPKFVSLDPSALKQLKYRPNSFGRYFS